MAREGFTTLTLNDEVYNKWRESWEAQKTFFISKGITTLTGFINACMFGVLVSPDLQVMAIKRAHEKEMEQFVKNR